MPYHLLLIQLLLGVLALFLFWQGVRYTRHLLLVKRLQKQPLPVRYKQILQQIPYYNALPQDLQLKMHYHLQLFIEEKEWEGIYTDVTVQMKVVIAFFACLLGIGNNRGYENVSTVLVYPYEFIAKEVRAYGGVFSKEKFILEGQSSEDTVVISWHSGKKEAGHFGMHNVIIHEFAHQMDFQSGHADGEPPLEPSLHALWAHTIYPVYEKLNKKSLKNRFLGRYKLFGSYAAGNEAEFFAVATELFFQKPRQLHTHFPKVYNTLKDFYKLDPKGFKLG
ncbi:MAG: zinc-dependent peptidase [Campylobacterota bacterium]